MSRYPLIKTIRDIEDIERTPWREYCPHTSTFDIIQDAAARHGDLPAIMFLPFGTAAEEPHTITYEQFAKRVTGTANLFRGLNVGSSDVVSYILPNLPETQEIIWGAEAAGIVNAINPLLEPETIRKLLIAAETKVIVTTPPLPTINLWDPLVAIADELSHVTTVVYVDPGHYFGMPRATRPTETPKGKPIVCFQDARDQQPDGGLNFERDFIPSDIASLFHTGGTTGTPKLAPHTHENEVFNAWAISRVTPFEAGEKAVVGLPLFHVNAVIVTGLASMLAGVAQIMVSPMGFRGPGVVDNLWQVIDRFGANSMSGVPTIYSALISVPTDGLDLSSFRFAAVGAAPLSPELFRNFVEYSGVELLEGYGLTESTVVATTNPLGGEKRVGSIGLRMPYLEMQCAELDEHGEIKRFCDTNEVGTIVIRGPSVFPGYHKRADNGLSSDGWLNTGDLGRQDEDQYFWITGRSKDVIIRGGHNIDPSMIENTLEEHDAVALAAAIGQPDVYAGELPAAYVQLHPGAEIDAEALRLWAKERIPERAAAPVYLEVMEALPVTAVGKIHKPPLRAQAIQRVVETALADTETKASVEVLQDAEQGMITRVTGSNTAELRKQLGDFALTFEFIAD
ncbi:MAG: acyl-CoA synthetase [Parvularculaceae bacterium]|nr:acyl-CoA synthetase [Parvularculaceae bacterium]